jgi:beta-mannanase
MHLMGRYGWLVHASLRRTFTITLCVLFAIGNDAHTRASCRRRTWRRAALCGILLTSSVVSLPTAYAAGTPAPMPNPRSTDPALSVPAASTGGNAMPAPRTSAMSPPPASGPAANAPTPRPASGVPTTPPALSVRMGVYIPGGAQDTTLLDQFEAMTSQRMAIVHWYQPWGYTNGWYAASLDTNALNAAAARGATPLITWEAWGTINGVDPSHVANIPTGAFDDYIDTWAQGLKAFGKPVYLRLFHEMNFQGYPWAYGVNGNTAQDLVAAWRYVHDRFVRIGAANVQWVWCPNPENGLVPFSAIYPGDAYVDWFGTDVYNGGTQFDWGGWLSAQQLADQTYRTFLSLSPSKPVIFAEASSVEQGGSKAQWITDLFLQAPAAFPNLRAIVWFDDNATTVDPRNLPVADWRVNTSLTALQAFRDV